MWTSTQPATSGDIQEVVVQLRSLNTLLQQVLQVLKSQEPQKDAHD